MLSAITALSAAEYRLQQTDVIRMTVYQEPDMTTESLVGKSGNVSFPLIGSLQVKGLTVPQLEKKIRTLYQKDYFVDPQVSVSVVSYAKKWVTVSGAVENPGQVPYPEEGTIKLASVIAMAGGVAEDGNTKKITLARKRGGAARYTLSEASGVNVYPGDTVVIPRLPREETVVEDKMATVSGQVVHPGSIKLPSNGKIDIITAIAMAGGYSKIANKKECILQVKTSSGLKAKTIRLRDITRGKAPMVFLREGDILIIKESRF